MCSSGDISAGLRSNWASIAVFCSPRNRRSMIAILHLFDKHILRALGIKSSKRSHSRFVAKLDMVRIGIGNFPERRCAI